MQVIKGKSDESVNDQSFRWYRDFFKRVCDVVFSLIAIIILVLPMLIISLLIKLDSPKEPVLFKQIRIGKDDVPFTIFKFRSMSKDAPHQMAKENFEISSPLYKQDLEKIFDSKEMKTKYYVTNIYGSEESGYFAKTFEYSL